MMIFSKKRERIILSKETQVILCQYVEKMRTIGKTDDGLEFYYNIRDYIELLNPRLLHIRRKIRRIDEKDCRFNLVARFKRARRIKENKLNKNIFYQLLYEAFNDDSDIAVYARCGVNYNTDFGVNKLIKEFIDGQCNLFILSKINKQENKDD